MLSLASRSLTNGRFSPMVLGPPSRQPWYQAIHDALAFIEQGKRHANPGTIPSRAMINTAMVANNGVLHPRLKDRLGKS
jgi:hypothetical protein